MPKASAPSVPGLGQMCQSPALAVRERIAVDDDDLGAALLRLEHERPVVQVGRDRIARPDHDVLAVHEALGIDAAGRPMRQQPRGRRARGAVGLLVDRRAEPVEERIARVDALHEAHVAEIALRHDRLRAVLGDDLAPALADLADRLVPGDALDIAREPFGPVRRSGYISRSGLAWWSWKSLSFTHKPPRVIGCSLLPLARRRACRPRPRRSWRRCRGSRADMRRRRSRRLSLLVHGGSPGRFPAGLLLAWHLRSLRRLISGQAWCDKPCHRSRGAASKCRSAQASS